VNRNFESLIEPELVREVESLPPPWQLKERGRPEWNPRIVAICCFLMVFYQKTYDSIESYLKNDRTLMEILNVDTLPGHSVIHRGMCKLRLTYVRRVMRRLTLRYRKKGMTFAVDSTGFSRVNRSTWFDIRIGRKSSRRDCLKLHIVADLEGDIIHDFTITNWKRGDSPQFKRLIRNLPELAAMLGDKGYSSRLNCQLVKDKNGTPYLRFKSNATGRAKGHPAWKEAYIAFTTDTDGWMQTYKLRNIIESIFSSIKRRWGSALRSRLYNNQIKELALKVLAYNMRQLLYVERARELGIDLRATVAA